MTIDHSIIVIIYDWWPFLSNNGIWKAWTQIEETFLHPKRQKQSIIASKFLLPVSGLNLSFLSKEKRIEVMEKTNLSVTEVVELIEYRKAKKGIKIELNFTNKWLTKFYP